MLLSELTENSDTYLKLNKIKERAYEQNEITNKHAEIIKVTNSRAYKYNN